MNKLLRRMAIVLMTLVSMLFWAGCTFSNSCSYETFDEGKISYSLCAVNEAAYIENIKYNPGDDCNIVLPDECSSYKVYYLGKHFHKDHTISAFITTELDTSIYKDVFQPDGRDINEYPEYEVIDIRLNITLPKELRNLDELSYGCNCIGYTRIAEDGSEHKEIIRFLCYFTIDENNPRMYTKDGKVYQKNKSELLLLDWTGQ